MRLTRAFVLGGGVALLLATAVLAQGPGGVAGYWQGKLKVGGTELRLGFHLERKKDTLTGTLDSLDQGARGIPISKAEVKDRAVRLEIKSIGAVYTGKLQDGGKTLAGDFEQGGQKLALTLKWSAKAPVVRRPQEPKKPYPYREEEVTFENKKAGVKFAGTLTLPKGKGPFACALLLSGSGPQDRDETLMDHKPFLVLADHLTRQGIAVLRVDDRGVGGSTGSVMQTTLDEFADDALAALAFLKGHKDIDPKRIGFIGHSEGGIVGPLAASRAPEVAFVVMLAGPGLPGEDILYMQGQAFLKATGAGEKELKEQRVLQEWMLGIVKQEKDNAAAVKRFEKEWAEKVAKMTDEEKKAVEAVGPALKQQFRTSVTRWFRSFLAHDPRPALRQLRCPVLALVGAKDVQVPPKENLAAVAAALKEGGNKDVTVKEMAGLNHLFQTCKTGSLAEYAQIEETFAPVALELVRDWLLKRVKKE